MSATFFSGLPKIEVKRRGNGDLRAMVVWMVVVLVVVITVVTVMKMVLVVVVITVVIYFLVVE